jgi:hypothetical protein
MKTTYYYLVMSQKDFLQNQVLEEILREKASYYNTRKKNLDYWVLVSPKFLFSNEIHNKIKKTIFYKQKINNILVKNSESEEKNYEFYISLISVDKQFMEWIKLRLGYFEDINTSDEIISNLNYSSDGICGKLVINSNTKENILLSNKNFLHPDILINRFKKSLEKYYYLNN